MQAYRPLPSVEVLAEPFYDEDGEHFGKGRKGSLGIDVVVKYKGKVVLGMELKTGRGASKSGINKRIKHIGADFIQVTIKMDGK